MNLKQHEAPVHDNGGCEFRDATNPLIQYRRRPWTQEQDHARRQLMAAGVPNVLAHLFSLRGVNGPLDIDPSVKPISFRELHDIRGAAGRLVQAIKDKDRICVVADYDVDGATSCAIAVRGLRMLGADVDFMVPNRFVDGYGLTVSVIDRLLADPRFENSPPKLIVTVDNGTSSLDGIEYAGSKGLEVLVTDHHLPGACLPSSSDPRFKGLVGIINPNKSPVTLHDGTTGPHVLSNMAGCGVIFMVCCATQVLLRQDGLLPAGADVGVLIDLVATGTVADVVKLDRNNRILVTLGLKRIRAGLCVPGIKALFSVSKSNIQRASTQDIGFRIGPRLNAAGRMNDMSVGIQCLLTDDEAHAFELATQLQSLNEARKTTEKSMREDALDMASDESSESFRFSRIVHQDDFHEGVIGIVASRIKDIHYVPTLVFAPVEDHPEWIKGSGRSITEINLKKVLDRVHAWDDSLLVKYGGHAMAAGMTVRRSGLDTFKALFDRACEEYNLINNGGKKLCNIRDIDMEPAGSDLTLELSDLLQEQVWGQGFQSPVFAGEFRILDQRVLKDTHLKLTLEKDGVRFPAIWFFQATLISQDQLHTLIYQIDRNEFNGRVTLQLKIEAALSPVQPVQPTLPGANVGP